jgi:hypothetical protein
MLHALLHRKIDESIPEPQQIEDALTSTVFGTLVLVGAWEVLAHWLDIEHVKPAAGQKTVFDYWFWPRLAFAQPDVLLRFGRSLVVVEAKYRSGRHDLPVGNEAEEDLCDQLLRQHRCVTTPPSSRASYINPIEQAISECHVVQIFVVDARRQRRARREYEESKARLPADARLTFVTWQRLFRLLNGAELSSLRWAADLRAYLELSGLDTFESIGRRVADPGNMRQVSRWRARRATGGLRDAVAAVVYDAALLTLRRWRPLSTESTEKGRLPDIDGLVLDGSASRRILEWRAGLSHAGAQRVRERTRGTRR